MKKISYALMMAICFAGMSNAQWVKQNAPTANNLNDVEFANNNIGFAVGANGTVIKTADGGINWQLLAAPTKDDLVSVTVIDSTHVFATSSGNPSIYKSGDGGNTWQNVLSDLVPFYITHTPGNRLFSVSRKVYGSNKKGVDWQTLASVNSTSNYFHISFADNNTGIAAGNISGFVTYSADFLRTFDGGGHWYPDDPFSFPNANGFTAMNFLSADSVFMFTNFYNRFAEGDSSQLILLTKFRIRALDSSVVFRSKILVRSFADKIRDCKFFQSQKAYALGDKGFIYFSGDGGKNWKPDYKGSVALNALYMLSETNGFAVGDNGLILKRASSQQQRSQPQKLQRKIPVIPDNE